LADRLRAEPDDLEGWMLLGRAYKSMERFEPAREALSQAYRLAPENPDVLVEYAESMVLASDSRRFSREPLMLLQQALALQPDNSRGQWLLGIGAYQEERYGDAVEIWERLLLSLPLEADARGSLVERIDDARQRAGMPARAGATSASEVAATSDATPATIQPGNQTATAAASDAGPRLTVIVDIAPELKSKVSAGDVLFVFARAAQGPRMPLAIQRLPATSLPVTVVLDDSTSMMPSMKLSLIPQVVVGARISKSGQAAPSAGDLETLSEPISNAHGEPLTLVIDRVLP
jgi:cytochrome c-type biogenesis protein CcmH